MIPDVIRNCSLHVDGRRFLQEVDTLTPPKPKIKTEEHRGGGMDGPIRIDMGMEAMECSFSMLSVSPEVLKLFGVVIGSAFPAEFRAGLRTEGGAVKPLAVRVTGTVSQIDWGDWKSGDKAPVKIMMDVRSCRCTLDDEVALRYRSGKHGAHHRRSRPARVDESRPGRLGESR